MNFPYFKLLKNIFKIPRSLAGPGNRKTLKILSIYCIKKLKIKSFKSGEKFSNWVIPKEWIVKRGLVTDSKKNKIIDFERNNLELVVNSDSFSGHVSKKELLKRTFTLKNNPSAIPYVTNYYSKRFWGVCMQYLKIKKLNDKKYFVDIITEKKIGKMNYGELFIKGISKKEILFSTYICHPQMANNELSGPVVTISLINSILKKVKRKKNYFSYRFLFLPETIGSISYINKFYNRITKNIFAGFILTCLGTNEKFKLVKSPYGNTAADKIATQALMKLGKKKWEERSFLERGSDERQWCSPRVNLPFCSITTSKYGEYKEYHTSLDDLSFISLTGLKKSLKLYLEIFKIFEISNFFRSNFIGEPKLDNYGLYPKYSTLETRKKIRNISNIIAYCDGNNNEHEISRITKIDISKTKKILQLLYSKKIISR